MFIFNILIIPYGNYLNLFLSERCCYYRKRFNALRKIMQCMSISTFKHPTSAVAKCLVDTQGRRYATICHGATGKGNDRSVSSWASRPWLLTLKSSLHGSMTDVWTIQSREDDWILQAARHRPSLLSWQQLQPWPQPLAHQPWGPGAGDPSKEPNYDHLLMLSVSPEKAPDEAEYVTMTLKRRSHQR